MIITKRITEISALPGFPIWIAATGSNKFCELVRATGFSVGPDFQHLTIFITERMKTEMNDTLKEGVPLSFLLASLEDFESYQIKGSLIDVQACDTDELEKQLELFQGTIDQCNALGLDGEKLLGFLKEGPFTAIRMSCQEIFEQTPKPGTGHKIEKHHEG